MEKVTGKYPETIGVLEAAHEGIEGIFKTDLVGLYLMGSLTYEDFKPGRSDIDLVAVLRKSASRQEMEQLKKVSSGTGSYVSRMVQAN